MAKKRATKRKSAAAAAVDNENEESNDEQELEVEKIIDVNYKKNGKREFLIRWKNYSAKDDTWEPEENLSCDELIAKFLSTQEQTSTEENGVAGGSSKSTPAKKKKSATAKAETPKNKAKSSKSKSEDEADYEVEKILDVDYKKNGKREFLIRWKNYSAKHDTWEPEENLSCDELIQKFLAAQEERDKQRKELRERPKAVSRYAAPPGGKKRSRRTAGTRKSYTENEGDSDSD